MKKIVLIIDEQSATGVIANVAAVLSMTIGYKIKELVGPDITDKSGFTHNGLTQLPIPVLGASSQKISEIINAVISMTDEDILLFDFNNFAQQAKTYEEYTSLIQTAMANDIVYLGIALYGNKKTINKITSGLSLIKNKL